METCKLICIKEFDWVSNNLDGVTSEKRIWNVQRAEYGFSVFETKGVSPMCRPVTEYQKKLCFFFLNAGGDLLQYVDQASSRPSSWWGGHGWDCCTVQAARFLCSTWDDGRVEFRLILEGRRSLDHTCSLESGRVANDDLDGIFPLHEASPAWVEDRISKMSLYHFPKYNIPQYAHFLPRYLPMKGTRTMDRSNSNCSILSRHSASASE
jgi:hypothetical protein